MAEILFVSHRIPYPPNKGDKIRAFQLIQALKKLNHKVTCAFPTEHKEDYVYVNQLKNFCDHLIYPKAYKSRFQNHVNTIKGLLTNNSLTQMIGFDPALYKRLEANRMHYDVVIFYSAISYFYKDAIDYKTAICDFVDMDSYKWQEYADLALFPMSWIYKREAKLLKTLEVDIAQNVNQSFFVTDSEKKLFIDENKQTQFRNPIDSIECSVDTTRFNAKLSYTNPFLSQHRDDINFVMTGAMDYKPNYDGALFFINQVLPYIQQQTKKTINFYCVGRNPVAKLKQQHNPNNHVVITGSVDDVKPYMSHSLACVAPLFIGRGIQNKVLEAMAMGKTCFVSPNAFEGIDAQNNTHLVLCETLQDWRKHLVNAIDNPENLKIIGEAATHHVSHRYHASHIQDKLKIIIEDLLQKNGLDL